MPNWCENTLTIIGRGEEGKRQYSLFKGRAEGVTEDDKVDVLCFDNFIPAPENPKIGVTEWQYRNWGTKWGANNAEIQDDWEGQKDKGMDCEYMISYRFDTAWSPPLKFVQKVSKQYPDLKFEIEYWEPNMCFQGSVTYRNGKASEEIHSRNIPKIIWEIMYRRRDNGRKRNEDSGDSLP